VFISFVFFLIYFSLPDDDAQKNVIEMDEDDIADLRRDMRESGLDTLPGFKGLSDSLIIAPAILDSIRKHKVDRGGFRLSPSEYNSVREYDSIQLTKPPSERHGWFVRKLSIRSIELNEKYKGKGEAFVKDFGGMFKENFSKVLFWLLPFFALVLKLLYIRRDFYYSEHLVQTIYYYNFFYLAASVVMLINLVPGIEFVGTILGFWIYLYLLFAMKRLYKQSWGKTILKFLAFSFLFSFFLLAGFSISVLWILMSI
jgi:hypothetical protein